jgi:signal transduction histidine kinase
MSTRFAAARARAVLDALEHLAGGLGTALLAVVVLAWLLVAAALCLVGIGFLVLPSALGLVRAVADRERARLSRRGREIIGPAPLRRELGWLVCHATIGFLLGGTALTLPVDVLHDTSLPLWWQFVPPEAAQPAQGFFMVTSWGSAFLAGLLGLAALAITVVLLPPMARWQAWPGIRLLSADHGGDLSLRVAQLTATRAAALDAHAAELRRIERSLHDGTQNRLVAVTVLIGAAQRALTRDPLASKEILDRAQDAAEQALAELRGVVRSILPPVLADRSLPDALTALAAACPVTCRLDADLADRCAMSVEATAYFVVAEALTNVARHSQASAASIFLRRKDERLCVEIADDGAGGASEHGGSGLSGIRRRVEAHDGAFELTSPVGGPTVLTVSLPCGL